MADAIIKLAAANIMGAIRMDMERAAADSRLLARRYKGMSAREWPARWGGDHKHDGEAARRRRQIAAGSLKEANGLVRASLAG